MIKSNFFLKHRKMLIICGVLVILMVTGMLIIPKLQRNAVLAKMKETIPTTEFAEVTSGDINLTITGSGFISSSSTKNISSEVSAKVEKVNIEVGDKVNKGDVLFILDSSNLDTQIRAKQKTITNYRKSINEYNEDINNLNVYSDVNGYVKNVKVAVGDSVSKNAVLFDIVDDSYYTITVNFLYNASNPINVGDYVSVMCSETFKYFDGVVTRVSELRQHYEYGGEVQEVEIKIENPGYTLDGVSAGYITVTTQNESQVRAVENSKFKSSKSVSFRCPSSGTVENLYVNDGDRIVAGELLMKLNNSDLFDKLADTKSSLSNSYTELSDLKDDYSFYTIVAPIDGVITALNVSEGDYIRSEGSLATIVNTNKLQFQISVDELDILKIKVGQQAKITIDAIEETENNPIIGYVSEIGIVGTNMNSVTSYPVTITLDGREDIMMGMNCTVEIVVESAENAMVIPVEAVNSRKGKYYVTLEDGTEKEVTIGIYDEDNIEIKDGLKIGEKVKLPTKVIATPSTKESNENPMSGFMGGSGMPSGGFPSGGSFQGGGSSRSGSMPSGSRSSGGSGNRGGF